jgi:carbon storage regulator
MLVLSRKLGEAVYINDNIVVNIVSINGGKVRLGFEAPSDVRIMRSEIDDWSRLSIATDQSLDNKAKSFSA